MATSAFSFTHSACACAVRAGANCHGCELVDRDFRAPDRFAGSSLERNHPKMEARASTTRNVLRARARDKVSGILYGLQHLQFQYVSVNRFQWSRLQAPLGTT
jgi:hypothetical protein